MSITWLFVDFSEYRWVYRSDPEKHYPSYAFDLPPQALADLMLATQKVAKKLDKAFPDVSRTGMFFEGFGVDHVHSKLSPMHGTGDLTHWKPIESRQNKFSNSMKDICRHTIMNGLMMKNWPRWRPEFVSINTEHFCRMAV